MSAEFAHFNFNVLALIWRQQAHGRRLVVGHLRGERFAYDGPDLEVARALGFAAYPAAPSAAAFVRRLPAAGTPELAELLQTWAVDPSAGDPLFAVAASGAPRANDTFELIPRIVAGPGAYFRTELAGFQYYVAAEDLRPLVGARLDLEADPRNRFDRHAVVVRYHGVLLGYVKRIHNEAVIAALAAGLHITAMVELVGPEPLGHAGLHVLLGVRFEG
ncbi:MAG: hypothetical protein JO247_17920 [Chloroflexi bacterium]|nr:hypothetical protein [Chloroflexota bacterium]